MKLHDIHRGVHRNRKPKRLGRGTGSGRGKTAGRGHKGQGQLAGWTSHPTFEGGRMPVVRRIPKRGFHNQWGRKVVSVNLGTIDKRFTAGARVTLEALRELGIGKGRCEYFKVLGHGELTKPLTILAHGFSKSAREKIERAGGTAQLLEQPLRSHGKPGGDSELSASG